MNNVVLTEIYKARNIELDAYNYDDLANSLGESTLNRHFTIDRDTFLEFDDSIPHIIGDSLYKELCEEFYNNNLDYIHIYSE